jgi:hypothetical protein
MKEMALPGGAEALTTGCTNSCGIRPIQWHPGGGPAGRGGVTGQRAGGPLVRKASDSADSW